MHNFLWDSCDDITTFEYGNNCHNQFLHQQFYKSLENQIWLPN